VLIGSILSVVFGVVSRLYFGAYYASEAARDQGPIRYPSSCGPCSSRSTVLFTYVSRATVRELLERRWRAGIGLKRILIAGAGDLGRSSPTACCSIASSASRWSASSTIAPAATISDTAGCRCSARLPRSREIAKRERVDHLYVTLPLEEHAKLLDLMEITSREYIDVKVVPDLLQFIALRARLEDLDGLPVINLNEVPLQGFNSWLKRTLDVVLSGAAMMVLAIPFAIISALVKWTSPGPVFYRQERMGLDGKAFTVYKFRSMNQDAEDTSGPVWARDDDPRATQMGRWLRRFDLDELPQFWNVLRGDMSIVGPRPERPFFVEQFRHRIPQYMLRHKVKAGITGWAQVNGWRGNTSLEKRIEYDLYYIENWSVTLDLKIMWLTLVRGLFQRGVAY
jgi:Undecaprenyl-phosphate glucose phosphotransferase